MSVRLVIQIIVPVLVFFCIGFVGFFIRQYFRKLLEKAPQSKKWAFNRVLVETLWHPIALWFMFLGAYVAVQVSVFTPTVKNISGALFSSIFIISLIWVITILIKKIIDLYTRNTKSTRQITSMVFGVFRVAIFGIGLLVIMDVWQAPTLSVVIVISTGILILGILFRNTLDNLLAGIEIAYCEHIKVGHLVKLESGETGYVTHISWTRTIIKTNEGSLIIIPNFKLMAMILVNYSDDQLPKISSSRVSGLLTGSDENYSLEILSNREREVLSLIGSGATNREIAQKLIISEHTVKSHIESILSKLNIHNRQQAAVYAERAGLMPVAVLPKSNS
jgi:DNA-binding CsgD family transcriptional regulator/small-conductance mechanosensitive channel